MASPIFNGLSKIALFLDLPDSGFNKHWAKSMALVESSRLTDYTCGEIALDPTATNNKDRSFCLIHTSRSYSLRSCRVPCYQLILQVCKKATQSPLFFKLSQDDERIWTLIKSSWNTPLVDIGWHISISQEPIKIYISNEGIPSLNLIHDFH